MSYLKFDRSSLTNLEESLEREILCANRCGGYYCTSILGCNTRKYHGMLVVPSDESLENRWVLLSSLDETVIQHGAEFNLSVHRYADGTYSPNGHKYIRELDVEKTTRIVYRVGGVLMSKEFIFSEDSNRLIIKYKLLEAHSPTTLRFKPFLGFRKVKALTYENSAVDWTPREEDNGISWCLYEGFPRLYMQFTKKVSYLHEPHWNKNLYYHKEAEREHACIEDLPIPGFFECEIKKGEEIYLSISDEAVESKRIKPFYKQCEDNLIHRDSFINALKRSVEQFYFQPEEGGSYILAGLPWFNVCHRDQMIGLTAASFGIGKPERFDAVMSSDLEALWRFYEEGVEDNIIKGLDQPDALLWVINCIHDYSRWVGMEQTRQKYGDVVERAMSYLKSNKHPQMKLRDNALLYAVPKDGSHPITWMDGLIDGYPVVDRQGYIVEYNALWYDALCFYRVLFKKEDDALDDLIDRVSESFVRVFVNEHDYLFDYVAEGRPRDWNVRPNQLFAVGLSYSPLSRKLQRSVLDIVTRELLTPKGIRTLSPKSGYYRGYCNGSLNERTYAYLQGGVWTWLVYYYLSGYLKLFKRVGLSFVDRLTIPFEDEMAYHGIGTISEVYDGTPPYVARNGISFMPSVTAILRIKNRIIEYEKYGTDDIFDLRLSMTTHHTSSPDVNSEGEKSEK
ncbi:glycogen debranching enzyme N-terminal domain-containing protein [Porphyromonadaceae bacterium W3.11]|nr:glycogen debranching enzyme N-terminal domain-containing protein [Porphyromonadaceae bacterium W3.11]